MVIAGGGGRLVGARVQYKVPYIFSPGYRNKKHCPRPNAWDFTRRKGESEPFMRRELYLQRTARERLASGRLPRMHSQCIWGGYGRGDACSLCGEPIRSTEVEFEVPEPEDDGRHAGDWHTAHRAALKFHIWCHAAWQLECSDLESAAVEA